MGRNLRWEHQANDVSKRAELRGSELLRRGVGDPRQQSARHPIATAGLRCAQLLCHFTAYEPRCIHQQGAHLSAETSDVLAKIPTTGDSMPLVIRAFLPNQVAQVKPRKIFEKLNRPQN